MSMCSNEVNSEMEAACKTDPAPCLEPSRAAQLPDSTHCLACSADGRFLSLGHSQGVSVWCASALTCAAEWLQDGLEITSVQMTRVAENVYLLATIDDMGVSRVFAYQCESVHLLSVINIMENINKRSICLTFDLSEEGNYAAASISCNDDVWIEVYCFPIEAWLKELEAAQSQHQDPNASQDVDVKWSPVTVVIKMEPPGVSAGKDFFTHCLALDSSSSRHRQKSSRDSQRRCTHHFLLPCARFPGDRGAKSQPGSPAAVCVWWSGSQNLLQYLLHKAPNNKPDVASVPDVLWPNAKEILCSAVSGRSRYVALGLSGALVCVWDRLSGSPSSVVSVSAADSAFSRIQFVDHWSNSDDEQVCLLLFCKSGQIHTVATGRGTQPCAARLSERPKDSRELPTVTASVPFLQSVSLVVQRNGKMLLQDVINRTTVCLLVLPTTHLIAAPCSPVYAINTTQHTLLIKGDPDPRCSASPKGGSQLFFFHCGESDVTRRCVVSPPQQPDYVSLEESCELYLQQRAQSVDERNKAIMQTWKQLQETS